MINKLKKHPHLTAYTVGVLILAISIGNGDCQTTGIIIGAGLVAGAIGTHEAK